MGIFVLGLILFGATIIAHLFWCRKFDAGNLMVLPFLCLSLIGFCLLILVGICAAHNSFWQEGAVWRFPLFWTTVVFYVLMIPFYLIFYFGLRVESPTRRIMRLLSEEGAISLKRFSEQMSNDEFLKSRILDLLRHDYLGIENEEYFLTMRGIRIAKMLEIYQKISGRGIGG